MKEFELKDYLEVIRRRIWIIVLLSSVLSIISGIVSVYVIKPEYQTYASLLIGRPAGYEGRLEYYDVLLSQKLAATYGEIARSRSVAEELISRLKLDFTVDEIKKKISVAQVRDTEIIRIAATDNDPALSAAMANEASRIFIERVIEIMKIANVEFIDMAEVPLEPIRPKPVLNIAVAAASGLIAGVLFILLIEYFDNTLKTPEDVKKHLNLTVIGMIPKISQ